MKQMDADIAVIGGGTAGMAAAIAAAENGAKVVILEKAARIGGAGNMARGPFAVESKLQKMRKINLTKEEVFKTHMDFTHWQVDARLVSEYINKSASTIDWLEKMGVEFIDVQSHNQGCNFTWHVIKGPLVPKRMPGTGVVMMRLMAQRAEELGVVTCLKTPTRQIIIENGRITGVIAEDESGEEIRIKVKAAIVATGGFGDNSEMIRKYTGLKAGRGMVAGMSGDGIRMAWEVGAAPGKMALLGRSGKKPEEWGDDEADAGKGKGGAGALFKLATIAFTFGQPVLMVNLLGERFMNEEIYQTSPFGRNAVDIQKKQTAFAIFDEDTKKHYMEEGLDFPPGNQVADPIYTIDGFDDEVRQAAELAPDTIFVVDSIGELAARAGLDKERLIKTVEEYNRACDTGRDDIFHKNPRYLRPVRSPKFYAKKMEPPGNSGLGTAGGIKINYKTEVIDKDYEAIPGLYAAGLDANSIYGDTYIMFLPGNYMGFALNSGRMAGENAAEFIKRR